MKFSRKEEPNHEEAHRPRKWACKASRDFLQKKLAEGKGPTEAYEDTVVEFGDQAPSINSARKAVNPGRNTVSTQLQLLNVLSRTYAATVNADSRVPGYVQVR